MEKQLSHIGQDGGLKMVDVGDKKITRRVAVAEAVVELSEETLGLLEKQALPKGDALVCAKAGGILAAKRTDELIPHCHSLGLSYADIRFETRHDPASIRIEAETRSTGQTGVEMEAIIAVQTAAAIIYDMCKAAQRDIVISNVRLLYKNGGKSGEFRAKRS